MPLCASNNLMLPPLLSNNSTNQTSKASNSMWTIMRSRNKESNKWRKFTIRLISRTTKSRTLICRTYWWDLTLWMLSNNLCSWSSPVSINRTEDKQDLCNKEEEEWWTTDRWIQIWVVTTKVNTLCNNRWSLIIWEWCLNLCHNRWSLLLCLKWWCKEVCRWLLYNSNT
jgi:hypothetical protein